MEASVEQVAAVQGIGDVIAKRIKDALGDLE